MLRIANCSGFWGDRFSAAEEMIRGGPIDVLTGDYLAELTMAILHKRMKKELRGGFVPTFLGQMERVLGECLQRKIRVVTNAGGLDPRGLAEQLEALAARLGLHPRIAWIDGDDLLSRLEELQRAGEPFAHMESGRPLLEAGAETLSANGYLGGWGICEALARGADVVVCPRVTDAALVVGPAAWRFGWRRDDWDRLAGAVAAGHILECSTQATGGNYAFFDEVPSLEHIGFPIAEMHEDGSFVITKHPATGGLVSIGTVTAQLLYEIESPRYFNPDVIARFDTLSLTDDGADRVRVSGARGEPPPPTSKVAINLAGGFRNTMTVLLGGMDLPRKARLVEDAIFRTLGGRARFSAVDVRLQRLDRPDPASNDEAIAYLHITVFSPHHERVGRHFSAAVVEQALSTIPGFSLPRPPADASPYLVYWPALVASRHLIQQVHVCDEVLSVAATQPPPPAAVPAPNANVATASDAPPNETTRRLPLGHLFGARSGDKGGNANLGVWARTDAAWLFLRGFLTVARLQALLPETAPLRVDRHELSNLRALNFYIHGLLGDGVASSARTDPQAKTLGEYLRAKWIDIPESLLQPAERDSQAP